MVELLKVDEWLIVSINDAACWLKVGIFFLLYGYKYVGGKQL